MIELVLYLDERGRSPFERWRADLDVVMRARISKVLERIVEGNFSNVKGLSGGISEVKIDTGPGYRVYFGREGFQTSFFLAAGRRRDSKMTSPSP